MYSLGSSFWCRHAFEVRPRCCVSLFRVVFINGDPLADIRLLQPGLWPPCRRVPLCTCLQGHVSPGACVSISVGCVPGTEAARSLGVCLFSFGRNTSFSKWFYYLAARCVVSLEFGGFCGHGAVRFHDPSELGRVFKYSSPCRRPSLCVPLRSRLFP